MYTMMQACRETGLTYQTLKFYCNEGLVPNVLRDKNNRRYFDDATVKWIKDLNCLKRCGMSIEEMKEYVALCLEGPKSIPQRQEILKRKQADLQEEIKKLQESMAYIDWKQGFYKDVLDGKRPYISNLIKVE
ncbi:MAG: MerR family transcriptional regulator [Phascolarctobacterium sp.]|nr:MerR family transcriptional regulator [Phascolarctobacterium sp.]